MAKTLQEILAPELLPSLLRNLGERHRLVAPDVIVQLGTPRPTPCGSEAKNTPAASSSQAT